MTFESLRAAGTQQRGTGEFVLGETLKLMKERGELDVGGRPTETSRSVRPVSLESIGLTKSQSSRYQLEASVPQDEYEAYVSEVMGQASGNSTGTFKRRLPRQGRKVCCHLGDSQRGWVALQLRPYFEEKAKERMRQSPGRPEKGGPKDPPFNEGPKSRASEDAGAALNVSRQTVDRCKTLPVTLPEGFPANPAPTTVDIVANWQRRKNLRTAY